MSKKKGLSVEEKRTRLLDLFHEKKDVFTLKELEKLGPKEKGITSQTVKDILVSLVSDDLVETDKIGSSVYFWSFPSKAINTKIQKTKDLKTKIREMKSKSKELDSELKTLNISEKELSLKKETSEQIRILEEKRDKLKAKLDKLKDSDPKLFEEMESDCLVAKDAANRWTDNVMGIRSWCKHKFSMDEEVINKQFEIPEDLDYIE